jgi:hypothetical protein
MATPRKRNSTKAVAKKTAPTNTASRVKDLAPKRDAKGAAGDRSGNTVYIGGASGGVWKTT